MGSNFGIRGQRLVASSAVTENTACERAICGSARAEEGPLTLCKVLLFGPHRHNNNAAILFNGLHQSRVRISSSEKNLLAAFYVSENEFVILWITVLALDIRFPQVPGWILKVLPDLQTTYSN